MASTKSKKSRKGLAVGLAILGVAGLSLASAATLTINSATLGSGVKVVASCDTDGIDVSYGTAFAATIPGYKVTSVTLKNVDATCAGKTVTVDLLDGITSSAATLGQVSPVALTLTTGTSQALTVPGSVDAAAVKGVAVVING
ncbi:hypothetical protein [Cellulomonas sp. P5_C6]